MKSTKQSGVALVITLLMLSVITFLTVTFLAISRRDRASVSVSISQKESRSMSDIGLARAQSEVIARMMGTLDARNNPEIFNYDLMVSRNYITKGGFVTGWSNYANVNYDYYVGGSANISGADRLQNLANLYYDPRPPVFIRTNSDPTKPLDFRYYVDLNRNGRFETNGLISPLDEAGRSFNYSNIFVGEPEWIGVLRNPEIHHSAANPFIGRYAYLVQPIGKTLDFNYIHNFSKANIGAGYVVGAQNLMRTNVNAIDGFTRSQGYGSWEINLAALLRDANPQAYVSNLTQTASYNYMAGSAASRSVANSGVSFYDAFWLLRGRYSNRFDITLLSNATMTLGNGYSSDGIDTYGTGMRTNWPFDYYPSTDPDKDLKAYSWAGSDNPVKFYNLPNDLYDTTRFSSFATRMLNTATNNSSAARYGLQNLLSSIGTESAPELQVDLPTLNGLWERHTKVNINYDNTHEITNSLNHATTNFTPWTGMDCARALAFFTNTADLILRMQFTNDPNRTITNLCVYSSANNTLVYDEVVHRCLQLAANIYDATVTNRHGIGPRDTNQYYPSVFRPLIAQRKSAKSTNVFIVGYEEVTGSASGAGTNSFSQIIQRPFKELIGTNIDYGDNVWGIPWVVGARKGLPNFNELSMSNSLSMTRKLEFTRSGNMNHPDSTNQLMEFGLTNSIAVELWNSYTNAFGPTVRIFLTNMTRIALTNERSGGVNKIYYNSSLTYVSNWPGFVDGASFQVPLKTNRAVLPGICQYLEQSFRFRSTNDGFVTVADSPGFPVHNWVFNMTNNLVCAIIDDRSGRVLDFVNLGNRGISSNLDIWLRSSGQDSTTYNFFNTNGANNSLSSPPSVGVLNQINACLGKSVLPGFIPVTKEQQDQVNGFSAWWDGSNTGGTNIRSAWFEVPALLSYNVSWQANDPLVHYTYGDLEDPISGNMLPSIGSKNVRYQPWDKTAVAADTNFVLNMTIKDPNISRSDDWNFPTNKFPNIGWLGRVHRGTPWQTIFLKADGFNITNQLVNRGTWTNRWARTIATYPTNDWGLLDLFTVAPNDNAACGTLSVNQTNRAPWSAVFSGALAQTGKKTAVIIDPTNVPAIFDGRPGMPGINAVRNTKPNRVFHRTGDILEAPSLTIGSPFLGDPVADRNITDEVVETIPQRAASLLRVGQPRFVIWAYGQSLKPSGVSLGGVYDRMPTNYTIVGESLTRTVCRVERATNGVPRVVVESFNVVPGE